MSGMDVKIVWETRPCEVDGEVGDFHCWEHYFDGCTTKVNGIVEFHDGVRRVDITKIRFLDEKSEYLALEHFKKKQEGVE